ncbi:PREDICTED: snRNA-activating protein complex subunit 3-like, partial [Cyprinodon variegatus]|uniref:snRNA-activating protein complex subunit 3-like n=1 Tax=Cyprinodon variegatus TaxID=28743 RepID=UPI000742CA1D
MAESEPAAEASSSSIPDYEYVNVNTTAFHIGSFREEWLKRLKPEQISFQQKDQDTFEANFAAEMGLEEETMAELRSVCSVDSLRCYSEDQQPDPEVLPSEPTLKTLIYRKKKQRRSSSYRGGQNRHELYAGELDRQTIGRAPESEADMVPEGELILSINIYFPVNFDKFNYMRPHVTLLMRGSQTLAELRDAIFCVSDLQVCGEFSNTPDLAPDFICKDLFRSAFFFFEGVFYDDMRHPDCQDIS